MSSLRIKYGRWQRSRSRSPAIEPQTTAHPTLSKDDGVLSQGPSSAPLKELQNPPTQHKTSLKPVSVSEAIASPPDCQYSASWQRAFDNIKDTAEWKQCSEILAEKTGSSGSSDLESREPLQKIREIERQVKQLAQTKQRTQDTQIQKVLDGTITMFQVVKDVGAVATANNPSAALGWSVVSYLITIMCAGRSVRKQCLEELPQVLDLTVHYQSFSFFYFREELARSLTALLADALDELFTAILNYQIVVVLTLGSRMTKVKISLSGGAYDRPQDALKEVQRQQARWASYEHVINRSINDTQSKKLQESIDSLHKIASADRPVDTVTQSRLARQERSSVLTWLSATEFENAHNDIKRQPVPGTTQWLLHHPDYISWYNDPASCGLWIQGTIGCGKTCLVHAVIEDQIARNGASRSRDQILYFYCDATTAEKKSEIDAPEKILRCLVRQLADQDTLPPELLEIYDKHPDRSSLKVDQCLDLLVSMSDRSAHVVIILDGFDECPRRVRATIIDCLEQLGSKISLRLLVASRPEPGIHALLHGLTNLIINVTDHTAEAISTFIETRIAEALRTRDLRRLYTLGTEDLTPLVKSRLTENAGSMFQWVEMALDFLHSSSNAQDMEDRLEELQHLEVLEDLYDRLWNDCIANTTTTGKSVLITALRLLLFGIPNDVQQFALLGTRTRGYQHVFEACTYQRNNRLIHVYGPAQLMAMCPSFIFAPGRSLDDGVNSSNDENTTLRIPHLSITEYLVSRLREHFSPAASHEGLATLCMRVFVEGGVALNTSSIQSQGLVSYALTCWQEHARQFQLTQVVDPPSRSVDSYAAMLHEFLLVTDCPAPFQTWASLMKRAFERPATYWSSCLAGDIDKATQDKVAVSITFVTEPPSTLYARIYLGLPLNDLTCLGFTTCWAPGDASMTPLAFAAATGQLSAIQWLANAGVPPNAQHERGETAAHILCSEGMLVQTNASFAATLQALINAGLRLDAKDKAGNTCFLALLTSEYVTAEVLQIFEDQGLEVQGLEPDPGSQLDDIATRPLVSRLEYAVAKGRALPSRESSMNIIFSHLANQFREDTSRTDWLCIAAKHGDGWLLNCLIEQYGADPTLFDEAGVLPLQHAMHALLECDQNAYVFDQLALLTLRPGFAVKTSIGFKRPVFEALLRDCTLTTIQLFVEYVAPVLPERCSWGPRPISNTLLFNKHYGKQIAEFLKSLDCVNAEDSKIYYNWQLGRLEDSEIGKTSYVSPTKRLAQDTFKENNDEEEQFWDTREDKFWEACDFQSSDLREETVADVDGGPKILQWSSMEEFMRHNPPL